MNASSTGFDLDVPVDMAAIEQALAPSGHYHIEGVGYLPRVSLILDTISKPGLARWAERQGEDRVLAAVKRAADGLRGNTAASGMLVSRTFKELGVLRQEGRDTNAATLGTKAHAWIEWSSRRMQGQDPGPEPLVPDSVRPAIEAWRRWASAVDYRPLLIEHRAWCSDPGCGYAGTLDAVGEVEGRTTLLDWKRASAFRESYDLQVGGAYGHLLTRSTGLVADRALIVKLPQQAGEVETRELDPLEMTELLDVFKALLRVWRWQHDRGGLG